MNTRVSEFSFSYANQAIISQNILYFIWLLLNYDLLENRRIDDVISLPEDYCN